MEHWSQRNRSSHRWSFRKKQTNPDEPRVKVRPGLWPRILFCWLLLPPTLKCIPIDCVPGPFLVRPATRTMYVLVGSRPCKCMLVVLAWWLIQTVVPYVWIKTTYPRRTPFWWPRGMGSQVTWREGSCGLTTTFGGALLGPKGQVIRLTI